MTDSLKNIITKLLIVHEGIKTTEYLCTAGHRTIGVGYNLDAHGGLPKGMTGKYIDGKLTISMDDAIKLLDISINEHYLGLLNSIAWYLHLDEWRQAALLDMAFNMGVPKFLTFKRTIALIQSQRFAEAGAEALNSNWAKQVQKQRTATITTLITKGELSPQQKEVYDL